MADTQFARLIGPGNFRVRTPDRGLETYENATLRITDGTLYVELPRDATPVAGTVAIYSRPFRVDALENRRTA